MRSKLVVGNWKMNKTPTESAALVQAFLRHADAKAGIEVVVCPPYPSLGVVRELLKGSRVFLGAQDVFWEPSGAFTGKVSASMLRESGVEFCLVGHSETRGRFGKLEVPPTTLPFFSETEETVNLKIRSLLFHSIRPILCVGETASERESDATESVIEAQLTGAFRGIEGPELAVASVAYEPVWAIGTGNTCDASEANRVAGFIRNWLQGRFGSDAEPIRVLYGGSVKSTNSEELFHQPEIDGGLVGGASLDPMEFSRIVMSA